jgi:ABC-type polysaccharide/polyol phosphate transport system ATPase subunit
MARTVLFDQVSKKYQLGLTRTSLPALLSQRLIRKRVNDPSRNQNQEFWALKDISFELHSGESLALIGRNGAGKTTMLKLLANITKPTKGSIQTKGKLSALIELGAGFHPDLTGRENIYLNGTILGLNRKDVERQFDEIVGFSELEQFIDTPVKRYSSGMTVRLGFAVASCIEPEILLVDEVLAVGDASFQKKCIKRIESLIASGTSIIFVSHNIYLVQAVCEKALYLQHGEVRMSGPTQEVINVYEQDLHEERARKLSQSESKVGHDLSDAEEDGIEISHVEVIGLDTYSDSGYIKSHQPAQIRIHYNAYKSLGKAHTSVFIIRSDGLTCCMLRTKLDDFQLDIRRGRGIVTVTLQPLQLVSGTYFVEAWFLNESDSMGVTTKPGRSNWFSVKGAALSYNEKSGIFEPHTHWEHLT